MITQEIAQDILTESQNTGVSITAIAQARGYKPVNVHNSISRMRKANQEVGTEMSEKEFVEAGLRETGNGHTETVTTKKKRGRPAAAPKKTAPKKTIKQAAARAAEANDSAIYNRALQAFHERLCSEFAARAHVVDPDTAYVFGVATNVSAQVLGSLLSKL